VADAVSGSSTPEGATVGGELARLRRRRGFTGQQLADLVGMSQAKISRIENNVSAVDPGDVEKIARALGAERDISRLVELAEQGQNRLTDWRSTWVGMIARQSEIGQFEASGTDIRVFNPSGVIGLLQTSEYARSVMAASRRMMEAAAGGAGHHVDVYEAVSARLRRHQVLAAPERRFWFVMAEAALSSRLCPPEEMVAQLHRIRELARQPNITIGIIPSDAWLVSPLVHGFEVVDDKWLLIDLFNTSVTSRGRSDVSLYTGLFESLLRQATTEIDDILDRYLEIYLDLSRPASRSER
jgi:transcriptional regulator with XRE-family HTH domain